MIEKQSVSRVIFNIFNYGFMILLAIVCVAPIWHVAMASISDPRMLMGTSGLLWKPLGNVTLKGYQLVLKNPNIITGYANTFIYVVVTAVLGSFLTLVAGYLISCKDFKLRIPLTLFIVFTMLFNGGLIPSYMVVRELGMINTRWAVILPGVINAFYIIVMKSTFEQLSPSYEESAKLDGAGSIRILFSILTPLVKPTVAVVVMFIVIQQWNSWYQAAIYLPAKRGLWPLQLFMREILVQNDTAKILSGSDAMSKADMTSNLVKYCITMVGTLPILCAYPFAQKYFVKGVTLGGVKE